MLRTVVMIKMTIKKNADINPDVPLKPVGPSGLERTSCWGCVDPDGKAGRTSPALTKDAPLAIRGCSSTPSFPRGSPVRVPIPLRVPMPLRPVRVPIALGLVRVPIPQPAPEPELMRPGGPSYQ